MAFELIYEKSSKPINWKLSIFGLIYLITRFYLFRSYEIPQEGMQSFFEAEILHTSYYISICMGLAMLCSFRVKIFNILPVLVFPVILFSLPSWDIPHLTTIDPVFSLRWWNALTIHIPILFLGPFMISARKVLLSKTAFCLTTVMIIGWFLTIDDKVNTTPFTGMTYILVAGGMFLLWASICWFVILKNSPNDEDPITAPLISIKGFKLK